MKILDKYLIKQFILFLFAGIAIFVFIFIIVDLSDNLSNYIDSGRRFVEIVLIYIYQIPKLIMLIFPIGSLIALFFSVGIMVKNNEFAIIKASGISPYRFLIPVFVLIILFSSLLFIFNETIVIKANKRYYEIKERRSFEYSFTRDFIIIQDKNTMIAGDIFDNKRSLIKSPKVFIYDNNNILIKYIEAKKAYYNTNQWTFKRVNIYDYKNNHFEKNIESKSFYFINIHPKHIMIDRANIDIYSINKLKNIIKIIRKSGYNYKKQLSEIVYRFFYIFVTLIILIIGSSFVIRIKLNGLLFGLSMSIFLSFLYWGMLQSFRSIGENTVIHPFIALLIPNLFFMFISILLLYKARK